METPTEMTARVAGKLIGILLVVIVTLCAGLYVYGLHRENAKLKQDRVGTTATAVAAEVRADGYATYIKDKEEVRARADETLELHPEYRDAVVPADVADLLREPAGSE